MARTRVRRPRLDLHNSSINIVAADAGRCGFTHLASGRVCWRPHHHPGACDLQPAPSATPASSGRLR